MILGFGMDRVMTWQPKSKGSALTISNLTSITAAPMASSSSSASTAPAHLSQTSAVVYKGKFTRSWPQLPDELVRFVTAYLRHRRVTGC